MLLNKKSMATLNELSSKLDALKEKLDYYETEKETALKELRSSKATVKDLSTSIGKLEKRITSYGVVIDDQTDPAQKAELESQKAALEAELAEKTAEKNNILALIEKKSKTEEEIEKANADIQLVVEEFASDPRINAHLQEAIEIKYDEQIEQKKQEKTKKMDLAEKFSLDLKEESVFGALVADLVKNYAEYKSLPDFALDAEAKKRASSVRGAFTRSVSKLKNAIASRPEYADLILTEADFDAIVAGPNAEGKYEIPSFQETISTIDKTVTDLSERKTKVLERIKDALASERIDPEEARRLDEAIAEQDKLFTDFETEENGHNDEVTRLEKEIADLKATFTTVNTTAEEKALEDAKKALDEKEKEKASKKKEIDDVDVEITDIDTKIAAVGFDESKLNDLKAKADIPDELNKEKEDAQKAYDEALKKLKDKGYIHKRVYPALDNEECKKAFQAFKDADLAVRKAFVDYQTGDITADDVKAIMEDYTKASDELLKIKGMEGLTVENWHDYLVRTIRKEAKEGEVDELYYDDVLKNRLAGVKEEYSDIEGVDSEYTAVESASDKLSELQEEFLKGKKFDFDKDIKSNLENYTTTMQKLFDALKAKKAEGLNTVKDLFGKLRSKIASSRLGGLFAKIKKFFTKKDTSRTISGDTKSDDERKEISDELKDLANKEKALEDAKSKIKAHLEDKLEPDEIKEFTEQEQKEAKVKELKTKKKEKEDRKAKLGTEFATLENEEKAARDLVDAKQSELEAAKARGSATPEQQAKLDELNDKKGKAATARDEAKGKKEAAKAEKEKLEKEKADLKPVRPETVVEGARGVAHGKGKNLVDEAIANFERDDDR